MMFLLFVFFGLLSSVNCQESGEYQVCLSIPRGPAGPPGPPGPMGSARDGTQCSCNFTEMENEMLTYREIINDLSQKVVNLEVQDRLMRINNTENDTMQDAVRRDFEEIREIFNEEWKIKNRLMRINNTENETMGVRVDYQEIRDIINEEWRKKNNCPVGISDGRIPDYDITASSAYNNDSDTYGSHLVRLDNQPKDGNIGAWRSYEVSPIRSITCRQAFFDSAGSSAFSSAFSRTDLVQMVRCPVNCGTNSYSYRRSQPQLYGSGIYTDFSSVCRAAIHNGRITNNFGGLVTIRRFPRKQYPGSTHNAISSSSYSSPAGSFTFEPDHLLQWVQVDFQTPTLLTGVVTQGRPTIREEWIESFKIQYGNNQTNLVTMKHSSNGTDIMFRGNRDRTSHMINMFLEPITARFVRLVAYTWHENISLRLEYLTC